jgi:hypothetical protein
MFRTVKKLDCKYAVITSNKIVACYLGWYGGKPTQENCSNCIKNNKNNKKARIQQHLLDEKHHPSNIPRISGCCDRADQA